MCLLKSGINKSHMKIMNLLRGEIPSVYLLKKKKRGNINGRI